MRNNMKKLLCFFMLGFFLSGVISISVEAAGIKDVAKHVTMGTVYEDRADTYYKLELPYTAKLKIEATGTLDFAYFRLYDENAEYLNDILVNRSNVTGLLSYSDYYYLPADTYYWW